MKILQLNDICYSTGEMQILKNINFSVNKGDFITVTGPSGSGKSTFFKLLNDLLSPVSGDILYRDKPLHSYDPVELRRCISLCLQAPYLFGDTILDNLAFPFSIRKLSPDMDLIRNTLKLFNFEGDILERSIRNLSGGEMQRVALARNLLFKPDILLLDEITSALDESNTIIIEQSIKGLNSQGVTVLWITHNNLQEKRLGNRNIYIEDGYVREAVQ